METARATRADLSVRKYNAEYRVRSCEEQLQVLRQELLDADRNLQEVDNYIAAVRYAAMQALSTANTSGEANRHMKMITVRNSTEFPSDDSASSDG